MKATLRVTNYPSTLFMLIFLSLTTFCYEQGVLVSSFVLLLELFPTPYQLQVSIFFAAFGMTSSMIFPLLMWIIKSWRYVQLAVSAPGIVFLAHVWFVDFCHITFCVENISLLKAGS
jgi:hypothetical protein